MRSFKSLYWKSYDLKNYLKKLRCKNNWPILNLLKWLLKILDKFMLLLLLLFYKMFYFYNRFKKNKNRTMNLIFNFSFKKIKNSCILCKNFYFFFFLNASKLTSKSPFQSKAPYEGSDKHLFDMNKKSVINKGVSYVCPSPTQIPLGYNPHLIIYIYIYKFFGMTQIQVSI